MLLQHIDKTRYRTNLNRLIIAAIVFLLVASLGFSTLFIALFSESGAGNFSLNLMAVITSCAAIVTIVSLNKSHPFMVEIYYVWQLKMELNFINAKLRHVERHVQNNDVSALIILSYYYQGSRQLWTLDDNTISIDSLALKEQKLSERLDQLSLEISVENYRRDLLKDINK